MLALVRPEEKRLKLHFTELPYDQPSSLTCTGSTTGVGPEYVLAAIVSPLVPITDKAPDYSAWFINRREQEQELVASASIVIGREVFPISSIPPKNLKVIRLLDEWFSEPDDLGEEAWKEFDRILAKGLNL